MNKKKKIRKIISFGFIIFIFIIGTCFFVKQIFKNNTDDMLISTSELSEEFKDNYFEEYNELEEELINISELPEDFMDNYFEEYNELEKEEKENMLIVISSEKINDEDYGAKEVIEAPNNKYYILFEDDLSKEKAINKLNEEESVKSVDENVKREILINEDEYTFNSWGIKTMGLDNGINLVSTVDANEVVVAILDTGCDVDLFNKYYSGKLKETYNVLTSDNSMYDNCGHGTHIAGTIAEGTPNNVKILPIKISDSRSMFESDIIAGIEYITYYEKADVINMSFGGTGYSVAEYQAIQAAKEKNIITVAAAGNDNSSEPFYPAAFDNTISIASVDENLNKSDFSNYGNTLTFTASGSNIKSLLASYMELSDNQDNDNDHETISGTSMATPHAASAAAILKSFNKNLTLENVISLLKNNVEDLGPVGYDYYYGYGLISFNNVTLADDSITATDEFGIFKLCKPSGMSIDKVDFTEYNYGSITNLLSTTVNFEETDGYDYSKKMWELEDIIITGYDPYSVEKQNVTIKYLEFETIIELQNPENYELGWEYVSKDDLYYLSNYKDSDIEICKLYFPEKINDKVISGIVNYSDINSNLFSNSTNAKKITEIIIPTSFKNIGDYAFSGLPSVNKIYINGSSVNIGESAFSDMPFLTTIEGNITLTIDGINVFKNDIFLKNITISDETLIIPVGTFDSCKSLEEIIIPESVEKIDDFAFLNSGIANINFSNGLKEIGMQAFKKSNISEIILPNSLERIGDYAFSGNGIVSIEIPKNVNSIGLAPFSGNLIETIVVNSENSYYDSRKNSNIIIETSTNKVIQGSIKSTIPSSVLIIGEASYSDLTIQNEGLGMIERSGLFTSLEIPEGVTTIEKDAFLNSIDLEKVVLPESINYIDSSVFVEKSSGSRTPFQQTVLWVHDSSYAHNYAIENDITYLDIINSYEVKEIGGFIAFFDNRIYHPNETVDVESLKYYYGSYESDGVVEVDIENYTIEYQNGDSLKAGDDKFYLVFDIENSYQNVKIYYDVLVEKDPSLFEVPIINLLIGERILDIITIKENGFGINIEGGILYFNDLNAFEEAGDYIVKGYFIATDSNYSDIWDLDIPVHVINKRYIKNEVTINAKISDGTTYIDPNTITLSGLDKSNYSIVSAYLESPDYIGNDAKATIKIRLNDDVYENYAFSGDKQEIEWTTTMTVTDINIPEINLLIGETFYSHWTETGSFVSYNSISFEEAGDYTIRGYYSFNDGSGTIDDILIPIHVINKRFVVSWAEISSKEYDGTTNIDFNTITLPNIDKKQYTIISAELDSPEVSEWGMAIIKVKLNDSFYENYAFTGNKQEAEWFNPIEITKGTPKYDVPQNLKAELGQSLYDISLPKGFEWTSENEVFNEAGNKTYEAKYTPDDTVNYKIIENIKITINVSLKTVTITYNSNDENSLTSTQELEPNKQTKLKENTFERKGFEFIGWNTKADGTGTTYSDKQEISISENLILYAQWKEAYSYIINKYSYDDNKKYIDLIDINTTVDDFKKNIDLNTGYSIDVTYKTIDGKNLLYTGSKTKIYNNNNLIIEYTNIIRGDVNGDGKINYLDYVSVYNHIQKQKHPELDKKELQNEYLISANMSGDDKVNYLDYVQIYNKIKELKGGK